MKHLIKRGNGIMTLLLDECDKDIQQFIAMSKDKITQEFNIMSSDELHNLRIKLDFRTEQRKAQCLNIIKELALKHDIRIEYNGDLHSNELIRMVYKTCNLELARVTRTLLHEYFLLLLNNIDLKVEIAEALEKKEIRLSNPDTDLKNNTTTFFKSLFKKNRKIKE